MSIIFFTFAAKLLVEEYNKRMKRFFHTYILRSFLIVAFTLSFICSDKNYGLRTIAGAEVLTLEEEHHLSELILRIIHDKMDSIMGITSRYYGFNGNVLVAIDNEPIYQSCSGYENFHQKKELTPQSAFQLASVSKQFTAIAILLLEQDGKLRIEDPLRKYIPELPYEGVTLQHLLNHTSGLPNYMWFIENYWISDSILPSNEDMIRILSEKAAHLNFTPGKRFVYSNTGYAVLASVVERISGQSFGSFLTDRIFRPLGMKNASVFSPLTREDEYVHVYGYRRSWSRSNPYGITVHDRITGDKGVYASVEDLFLWDQALNYGTLVSTANIRRAFTAGQLDSKRKIPYGFGFRLDHEGESSVVYHHGRWSGFRTAFIKYLPDNITIVILSNNSFNGLSQLASAFRKTLDHSSEFLQTKAVAEVLLTQGIERALAICAKEPYQHGDTRVCPDLFLQVADYLEHAGKQEKSRTFREFYKRLSS